VSRRIRPAATLLIAIGVASSLHAARPTRECAIEIGSNKPYVQVSVNNSEPLWFILDTGAGDGSILAKEAADRLGLTRSSETEMHIGAGEGVRVGMSTIPSATLEVAGDTMTVREMMVFPVGHVEPFEGRRVDGLLGADFLRRNVVEIDYAKLKLRIIDPAEYTPNPSAIIVPINADEGFCMAEGTIQRKGEKPIPCRFVIDTGVRGTLVLYGPFVKRHRFFETSKPMITATVGGGAGGETRGDLDRLERLRIGPIEFDNTPVVYSRDSVGVFAGEDADGIVGGEILRRCKTTFDYPHDRLVLEPYPDGRPFEYDMSGLFLVGQGDDYGRVTVFSVAARTPAAEAKLMKGDEIVSIDGRPASKLGLDGVRGLFRVPATYRLEVKRGKETLNLDLKTRRLV
jgi:predicted aspartyl protease